MVNDHTVNYKIPDELKQMAIELQSQVQLLFMLNAQQFKTCSFEDFKKENKEYQEMSWKFWGKIREKYPELLTEQLELISGSPLIRIRKHGK